MKIKSTDGIVHRMRQHPKTLHYDKWVAACGRVIAISMPLDGREITCPWCRINKAITNDGVVHAVRNAERTCWESVCLLEIKTEATDALDKPITCLRCLVEQT